MARYIAALCYYYFLAIWWYNRYYCYLLFVAECVDSFSFWRKYKLWLCLCNGYQNYIRYRLGTYASSGIRLLNLIRFGCKVGYWNKSNSLWIFMRIWMLNILKSYSNDGNWIVQEAISGPLVPKVWRIGLAHKFQEKHTHQVAPYNYLFMTKWMYESWCNNRIASSSPYLENVVALYWRRYYIYRWNPLKSGELECKELCKYIQDNINRDMPNAFRE